MIARACDLEQALESGIEPCYVYHHDPARGDEGHAYLVHGRSGETLTRDQLPPEAVYAGRFVHCIGCNQIRFFFLTHIAAATENGGLCGHICERCRVDRIVMERVPR